MSASTKIRPFSRLIDKSNAPFWVIDPDGRLLFLSAAVGDWLKLEPESLVGRLCVAGASISDDPLDYMAASLAPPPGFSQRGSASLLIQPAWRGGNVERVAAIDTRFVRLGDDETAITLAIGGRFADQQPEPGVESAVLLRQQLDSWRRHHQGIGDTVAVGHSRLAGRMQTQLQMAGSFRSDLLILSPAGCFAPSVATLVHQRAAAGEPVAIVDGPLMDPELLDASLGPLLHHLSDSQQTTSTAIINQIDEMPIEAQQRMAELLSQFGTRMRLIAIAGRSATVTDATSAQSQPETDFRLHENLPVGINQTLADRLCGLSITLYGLAERVDDITLIATSMLDRRRAAGEGSADRLARAALDALVIYPWPDNLRELDQAIRHALRSCPLAVIGVEHLPLAVRSYRPNEAIPVAQQEIDLDRAVERFEADLIRRTLAATDGNRAEAARRLNLSRSRLLRKLESIDSEASS
ncbi:hypothetical protein NHH03_17850 [Stieleria sp. TO1_6]|uniref:helix-turn-helix domain-containing protein n=1 Tax=Stieleria tagensis TaxID=2956795 RepID=UPI00209AEAEE|nr:helix-turn-helix domain-containing protein [Stieleria tagensis]MCO8123614.1 hypothetical protein [Stieleria tagensis]